MDLSYVQKVRWYKYKITNEEINAHAPYSCVPRMICFNNFNKLTFVIYKIFGRGRYEIAK